MHVLLIVALFVLPPLLCAVAAGRRGRSPWAWLGWGVLGGWVAVGILFGKAARVEGGQAARAGRGIAAALFPLALLSILIGVTTPGGSVPASAPRATTPRSATAPLAAKAAPVSSAAASASKPSSSGASAPTSRGTPTSSSTAPTPRKAVVLLDVQGSGTKSTQSFTVPNEWALAWAYNCSDFGQQGNFAVDVYRGGQLSISDLGVNELGMKGNDIEYYHHGGTIYLEVSSECNWHIIAQA